MRLNCLRMVCAWVVRGTSGLDHPGPEPLGVLGPKIDETLKKSKKTIGMTLRGQLGSWQLFTSTGGGQKHQTLKNVERMRGSRASPGGLDVATTHVAAI